MAEHLNPALRAVNNAVLAVSSRLAFNDVLQQLVESARELAGALRGARIPTARVAFAAASSRV